ncbi:MAG: Asp-tRNA(Asn)/Glu-tRNA(Gln) amidotransferase subunit GatB [Lentisphaeria bacterium]|nr:Asp-tRNA(Asn)/Glu-tRNA(Gln) amidotransferase subunit GatB [Lentisphaeria bacterium]
MSKYEAVIGLEVHIQVKSASKMFCSCPNSFGDEPNTNVCPVCMGYPGVLPVPNHEAIRKTVIAGLLTNCEISRFSKFDRKSYFYPDMPKNYQISQYDLPFCLAGHLDISGTGFSGQMLPNKRIGITRIHLEEDVAKLTHYGKCSGVDYNRAGVPLMETVSEPDMNSADEAYAYLTSLKEIMQYGGISDCDMEKGQMRCDVNISLRPVGETKLGTKIELKNLNSFRAVHRAIEFEIERQAQMLDDNIPLRQETRGWNDDRGESYLMRTKEQAHDYRYFPDPDLMPVIFTDEEIDAYRAQLPELPAAKRARFVSDMGLTEYDAEVITQDRVLADYFDAAAVGAKNPKSIANWIISELLREVAAAGISLAECKVTPLQLAGLMKLVDDKVINGKIAKEVFAEMFASGGNAEDIVKTRGLVQVSDSSVIVEFAQSAIAGNPKQVEQFKNGNEKILQYLVGQVMKLSKGKANPQLASEILKDLLSK